MSEDKRESEGRSKRSLGVSMGTGRLVRFARRLWHKSKPHSGLVLGLTSIIGTLLGAVGIYLALTADTPDTPITASQQELLSAVPPKVGYHCHPIERGEPLRKFERLPIAMVECQPVDPGPTTLNFVSFDSQEDMHHYMQRLSGLFYRTNSDCSDSYLQFGRWTGPEQQPRGDLICVTDKHDSVLLWSDNTTLLLGAASADAFDQQPLHLWWERAVKYEGDGAPVKQRDRLESLLPDAFGECDPSVPTVPTGVVGISCEPGQGISNAGAVLFANQALLDEYLEAFASGFPGATDKGCHDSTLSYSTWGAGEDAKPTLGHLLCYVSGGRQWFVWATNKPPVYAYASRDDESLIYLYRQWSNELSYIGRNG